LLISGRRKEKNFVPEKYKKDSYFDDKNRNVIFFEIVIHFLTDEKAPRNGKTSTIEFK